MERIKILSLTLIMSIFCAGTSFAQKSDKQVQKNQRTQMTPEERAAKRAERMKETLNLTPEQAAKLQTAQTQFAKEKKQIREESHQKMKAQREAYDAQLKTILTPEQYQKLQAQRKEMKKGGKRGGKWNKDGKTGNRDGKNRQGKCSQKRGKSQS